MPSTELRQTVLQQARMVVVKIGTQLLTLPNQKADGLDVAFIQSIASQIAQLRKQGKQVALVSSGAIGAGCKELGLTKRPSDLADLQAVAAIGQRRLMMHLHEAFDAHNIKAAQLLLTRTDFDDRTRYLNIRNCVSHLQKLGCLPIINENDTVSVDELCFGDNDLLAAMMCNALRADALVLLTVVDGLLDHGGQTVDLVEQCSDANDLACDEKSDLGQGGMTSKIEAARLATQAGEIAVIANGKTENILLRLFAGEKLGTVFLPSERKMDSRQRWISLTKRPAGTLKLDEGAVRAIMTQGKSLLGRGITSIQGEFQRGDVLLVCNAKDKEVARGLTNFSAPQLQQIKGKHSDKFEAILGQKTYVEVIHRDHLVLSPKSV